VIFFFGFPGKIHLLIQKSHHLETQMIPQDRFPIVVGLVNFVLFIYFGDFVGSILLQILFFNFNFFLILNIFQ
jgi:hypothetical protein